MKRKRRKYTDLGWALAKVYGTQAKMGKHLRVSQQTVSKKLRGECAILISDLQKVAKKVPVAVSIDGTKVEL